MKNKSLKKIIAAAFTLAILESAQAQEHSMEKCEINGYNQNGEETGLIKSGMADCKSETASCSGSNGPGDKEAWIYLPKGICGKIEGGKVVK